LRRGTGIIQKLSTSDLPLVTNSDSRKLHGFAHVLRTLSLVYKTITKPTPYACKMTILKQEMSKLNVAASRNCFIICYMVCQYLTIIILFVPSTACFGSSCCYHTGDTNAKDILTLQFDESREQLFNCDSCLTTTWMIRRVLDHRGS
jgi:hypothetical protein